MNPVRESLKILISEQEAITEEDADLVIDDHLDMLEVAEAICLGVVEGVLGSLMRHMTKK